jgi:hypothetical protein
MHMIHTGVEPHRLARAGDGAGIDPAADFLAVDGEENHGLHTHRLDYVEDGRKLAILIAIAAPRLGDVLGP